MSSFAGSQPRILVIRGGALGDFIVTLPAIRLLRENFPDARLEILGYKHIIALAEQRFYADAARSIEYGPVAAFFSRNAALDPELSEYFAGFQQIVSYLFDPDGIFEANLRRTGAKNILQAYRKLDDSDLAARQLARPLEQMALYLDDPAPRLVSTEEDRRAAAEFLGASEEKPLVAIHPGSGSPKKNWAIEKWLQLAARLQELKPHAELLVVGGEADQEQLAAFSRAWPGRPLRFARDLPLPHLAAVLERCHSFLGHDSGISHLAAAVSTPSLLLFGPTDPDVWKPANENVKVLHATDGGLESLSVDEVHQAASELVARGD